MRTHDAIELLNRRSRLNALETERLLFLLTIHVLVWLGTLDIATEQLTGWADKIHYLLLLKGSMRL